MSDIIEGCQSVYIILYWISEVIGLRRCDDLLFTRSLRRGTDPLGRGDNHSSSFCNFVIFPRAFFRDQKSFKIQYNIFFVIFHWQTKFRGREMFSQIMNSFIASREAKSGTGGQANGTERLRPQALQSQPPAPNVPNVVITKNAQPQRIQQPPAEQESRPKPQANCVQLPKQGQGTLFLSK